ncbi:MAG: hypothetical protein HYU36_20060 [Planctomycetes bacterium]|nr:hypothetical protein [Planctomycetota bacterium]
MRSLLYSLSRSFHYLPRKIFLVLLPAAGGGSAAAILHAAGDPSLSRTSSPGLLWGLAVLGAGLGLFLAKMALGRGSRREPVVSALLLTAAVLAASDLALRGLTPARLLLAAAILYLGGLVLWYIHVYSMSGRLKVRIGPGEPFPDFALLDSEGVQVTQADLLGRRVLFLLYRGDW